MSEPNEWQIANVQRVVWEASDGDFDMTDAEARAVWLACQEQSAAPSRDRTDPLLQSSGPEPVRDAALRLVLEQAEDEGLWFAAQTAPEAYLQQELRRLHFAVESAVKTQGHPEPVANLQRIAWLIGAIYVHGDFKAETVNERELEARLRANGTFWETRAEFDAALSASPVPEDDVLGEG